MGDDTAIELILLGTGSPLPDANRAGPAMLVLAGPHRFLVDAGRGVLMRTTAAGVGANQLTATLLTHLHSDHITDLSDVITTRWVTTMAPAPLSLIGPPGTSEVVAGILRTLRQDIGYRIDHHDDLTWEPEVAVAEETGGLVFEADGVRIVAAPTDHRPAAPSLGYRIEHAGRAVVLAGDTVPCDGLDELSQGADVLVSTVVRDDLIRQIAVPRLIDVCDYHSTVEQAADTAERAGVGTLVLTHCVPPVAAGTEAEWTALAAARFGGEVVLAADLDRVRLDSRG